MKRLTGSITFALVALVLLATPAAAGREWCAKDPVVMLNGTAVQILVAVPEEYVAAVNGPIEVRIALPDGVESEVVFLDAGFNGYGESVQFNPGGAEITADGSFNVRIRTQVPVSQRMLRDLGLSGGSVPVQVTVITNGELTWENGLPVVVNGETTVVEGNNFSTRVNLTVQGRT